MVFSFKNTATHLRPCFVRCFSNACAAWAICWPMFLWDWSIDSLQGVSAAPQETKKAGVVERILALHHASSLFDQPPEFAGVSFV